MTISIFIEPVSNAEQLITQLLISEFKIEKKTAFPAYHSYIRSHFAKLRSDLYLVAETQYIDKVYRDSYYHYFSSKLTSQSRNAIRISLFDRKIEPDDFRDAERAKKLPAAYLGFIVLRPTGDKFIGRSVISPKALLETGFSCCTTFYPSTVNAIKLTVEGFPHSSQDHETITCAETTLWAIMEYFSHRYAEYRPILPSRITQTLAKVSSERLVPAKGLNIQQMSFALKEFGFGTRIYSRNEYSEFDELISCYSESGLPLIVSMDNLEEGGTIAHALLCIGHEQVTGTMIDSLSPYPISIEKQRDAATANNVTIYDYDNLNKQFIFIDDNMPVYQKAYLSAPAAHYTPKNWNNCSLTHLIVPFYPKIYLEAFEAKKFVHQFLLIGPEPLRNDPDVLIRVFLTSTRSYKDKLACNPSINRNVKDLIIETVMPKFIWVCELSSKQLMKEKKAKGIIVLDATEANTSAIKPLILGFYQEKVMQIKNDEFDSKPLHLDEFDIFENNLKPFFV